MMEAFKKLKQYFKGNSFVKVDPEKSTITFTIQDGPIGEVGVNGTQIDEIGRSWLELIKTFNEGKYRCRENSLAITKIEEALMWQNHRTVDREKRNVEGTSEE